MEAGLFSQGGMGISPITWSELDAFNRCGGLELSSWELSRLMDMSRSYCSWNSKGSSQKDIADDVPHIDKSRSVANYLLNQSEISQKNTDTNPL